MGFGLRGSFFVFGHMYKTSINPIQTPYGTGNDFRADLRDNYDMEQMKQALMRVGLDSSEIERVLAYYGEDTDGLRHYVLYMRAILDDGNEYV